MAGTRTWINTALVNSAGTTYNFSALSAGDGHEGRYIALAIAGRASDSEPFGITAASVGGVPLVVQQFSVATTAINTVGIGIAHVPAGSSLASSVTFSREAVRAGVGMWVVRGIDPIPADVEAVAGVSGTVLMPRGGVALGVATSGSAGGATSWTGLTTHVSQNWGLSRFSSASRELDGSETGAVSLTNLDATQGQRCFMVVSYNPGPGAFVGGKHARAAFIGTARVADVHIG